MFDGGHSQFVQEFIIINIPGPLAWVSIESARTSSRLWSILGVYNLETDNLDQRGE